MAGFQWSDASIERPRKQQQPARHQHSGSHWVLGGGSRWGVQSCHAAFCCLLPGGGDGGQVPQLAPTLISSCGFAAGCCSRFHPVLVHGSQDCGLCSSAGRHRYVHPQRRKKNCAWQIRAWLARVSNAPSIFSFLPRTKRKQESTPWDAGCFRPVMFANCRPGKARSPHICKFRCTLHLSDATSLRFWGVLSPLSSFQVVSETAVPRPVPRQNPWKPAGKLLHCQLFLPGE